MSTCLIVGLGRAGRRHKEIAEENGLKCLTVDPYIDSADYDSLDYALLQPYDYAVIATPPGLHLEQAYRCAEAGARVLIEKPLCAFGQFDKALDLLWDYRDQITVYYNWRYHQSVNDVKQKLASYQAQSGETLHVALDARQSRELPSWGLILDHVSHSIDNISYIIGSQIQSVGYSYCTENTLYEECVAGGTCRNGWLWTIQERVWKIPQPPSITVSYEGFTHSLLPAGLDMHYAAWQSWLEGNQIVTLSDARFTQRVLESIARKGRLGV